MKRFTKGIFLLCIILAFSFSLAGCYGRNEIEETGFVLALGIEKGDDKEFKLTVQVPSPAKIAGSGTGGGGGGGEEPPYWLASTEADSLFDCFREISKRSSRALNFSHASAAIVGEEMARKGLGALIDTFARNAQMRPDTNIFITSESVEDILKVSYPLESLPSTYLARLQSFRHRHGEANQFELGDFYTKSQAGIEAVIPRVSIYKESSPPSNEGSNGEKAEKPPAKELIIEGAAAFRGDRMIGWLEGQDVLALRMINSRELNNPLVVEEDGCRYSIGIRESYSKFHVSPNLQDIGSSTVQIELSIETDLFEVDREGLLITNERLDKIAQKAEEQVNAKIRNLIQKAKYGLKSDIIGLGEQIRRKVPYRVWHPAEHNWNNKFPNLVVEVSTDIIIRRVGMTIRSPYIE